MINAFELVGLKLTLVTNHPVFGSRFFCYFVNLFCLFYCGKRQNEIYRQPSVSTQFSSVKYVHVVVQ